MVVQAPMNYGESQSMADAYMGGQKQASTIQYQEAIVNQMKEKSAMAEKEFNNKLEMQAIKNYTDSRKQYYDQLIKDPNGQDLVDQAVEKDKQHLLKIAPNIGQQYQNMRLKVTPQGMETENEITVDADNLESINTVSGATFEVGDKVKITKDSFGNQKYAKQTMTPYQEASLLVSKKKEEDKNFANVDIGWKNRADSIIDTVNDVRVNDPTNLSNSISKARKDIAEWIKVSESQNLEEEARYFRYKLDELTKLGSKGGSAADLVQVLQTMGYGNK